MKDPAACAPGVFIAFEGPEGAGKSTQIAALARRLERRGRPPLLTREPGGPPASERIREVLLDPLLRIDPLPEFLLYTAARAQHVREVIEPALRDGRTVISDRFAGASVAYQGYGRGLDLAFIHDLTRRATEGVTPDLTLLLDLDPEVGLARVAGRGAKDRLERAELPFHRRVRSGFLAQAEGDPSWRVLDADQPQEALAEAIWRAVAGALPALAAER